MSVYRQESRDRTDGDYAAGRADTMRDELRAAGIHVPAGKSPAYVEGFYLAHQQRGRIGRGAAPVFRPPDPFAAGFVRSDASGDDAVGDARDAMWDRLRGAYRTGRRDADASRGSQKFARRDPHASVASAGRLPGGEGSSAPRKPFVSHMRPAFGGGNQGDNSGSIGGDGMIDTDDVDTAEDARDSMLAKQKDAYKKPTRDARGRRIRIGSAA